MLIQFNLKPIQSMHNPVCVGQTNTFLINECHCVNIISGLTIKYTDYNLIHCFLFIYLFILIRFF
jgi:hypothetical protein